MKKKGTLQQIVEHLVRAIAPLKWATTDLDQFRMFMHHLGWEVTSLPAGFKELGDSSFEIYKTMEDLGDEPDLELVLSVIEEVTDLFNSIDTIEAPAGVNIDKFLPEISETLFEYLLVQYLLTAFPNIYTELEMLGLIEIEVSISGADRPGYVRSRLNYRKIASILTEPQSIPTEVYGWGSVEFIFSHLSSHLLELFHTLGMLSSWEIVPYRLGDCFQQGDSREEVSQNDIQKSIDSMVKVGLFDTNIADQLVRVGFAILEFPGENDQLPGIIIQPLVPENIGAEVPISKNWSLKVRGRNNLPKEFGIALRPEDLWIRFPFLQEEEDDVEPSSVALGLKVNYAPEAPSVLLGQSGKTRLQLQGTSLGLDLKYLGSQFELCLNAATQELAFVVNPKDLDNFLSKLIGDSELTIELPFLIAWSSRTGVTFGGSPGFSVATVPHLTLGPLTIERFALDVLSSFGDEQSTDLSVAVAIDLSARLGPVTASVNGTGLRLTVIFPDHEGFDVAFGYQAPSGVGLAIDAKGITGGGFLDIDPTNARYTGYFGLNFGDIGLAAVGLILTKLPDGSDDFSLLVSIGAKFSPPLQLSMGFMLTGVGGLIGVNRSLSVDALRTGFKNRSLDAILFPEPSTVIANASSIINGLENVFPATEGQYIVGPMVKIGWGSPPIISAEVGVFMAFPDPVTILLLGQVAAALPKQDNAMVLIQLDVLGVVDFAREELTFQASLYESHILKFKLAGDSAFLLGWGHNPRFALAMGGFHPAFTPPPPPAVFADLKRLSLNISSGKGLEIKCQAYQALTPTSLQFGARVNLYAKMAGFSVKGYLGFDALFCFSPFYFEVEICGGVHLAYKGLSLFGVDLNLLLSGPSPWHARGKARIRILFFSIKVGFNISWGSSDQVYILAVDPWEVLRDALTHPTAWGSVLPPSKGMVETLCGQKSDEQKSERTSRLLVHPMANLEIRQNILPLGIHLDKLGNSPVKTYDRLEIDCLTIVGEDEKEEQELNCLEVVNVDEYFSRGQFQDLSSDEKLSLPSFEKMQAGVADLSQQVRLSGDVETKQADYKSIILDDESADPMIVGVDWGWVKAAVAANTVRTSTLRAGTQRQYKPIHQQPAVSFQEERYYVARTADLRQAEVAAELSWANNGLTRMCADQLLRAQLELYPEQAGDLIIIPAYELAA